MFDTLSNWMFFGVLVLDLALPSLLVRLSPLYHSPDLLAAAHQPVPLFGCL